MNEISLNDITARRFMLVENAQRRVIETMHREMDDAMSRIIIRAPKRLRIRRDGLK